MLEYIRPLVRKISSMVQRGIVTGTSDATKAQGVQVLVADGVVRGPVEYLQAYGFTSQALAGADVVMLNVGGSADLPVVIVVSDRRYRPKVLPGESVLYDDQGQSVAIRRGGIVIDAAGRPDGVKVGAGATLAAARATDPVTVNAALFAWMQLVQTATTVAPLPVGTAIGTIASGSGVVKIG